MSPILVQFDHYISNHTCHACNAIQVEYIDLSSREKLERSIKAILLRHIASNHDVALNRKNSSCEFTVHLEWYGFKAPDFATTDLLRAEPDNDYFRRQAAMVERREFKDSLRVQFRFEMRPSVTLGWEVVLDKKCVPGAVCRLD